MSTLGLAGVVLGIALLFFRGASSSGLATAYDVYAAAMGLGMIIAGWSLMIIGIVVRVNNASK